MRYYIYFLYLCSLLFIFFQEEWFSNFYPEWTICDANNSTYFSQNEVKIFNKSEWKYVYCAKEDAWYNPFAWHTLTTGIGNWGQQSYFIDGINVWDFWWPWVYDIFDGYWAQWMDKNNGSFIQSVHKFDTYGKVYWHDVQKPYCAPSSQTYFTARDTKAGIPIGTKITPWIWYSGGIDVRIACQDDLSGCKDGFFDKIGSHGSTGATVEFQDNAWFDDVNGNIIATYCYFPQVKIDTVAPKITLTDGLNWSYIRNNNSSDSTDLTTWWYYYASGITLRVKTLDSYALWGWVSRTKDIIYTIKNKATNAIICTSKKTFSFEGLVSDIADDSTPETIFTCADNSGIQKKWDYLITVDAYDFAGNKQTITQDIRVVPNEKLSVAVKKLSQTPASPATIYANGDDYYLYEAIVTDSYGNTISGKTISSVTQTGTKMIYLDDRYPGAVNSAVASKTGDMKSNIISIIPASTVKTPLTQSDFTTPGGPFSLSDVPLGWWAPVKVDAPAKLGAVKYDHDYWFYNTYRLPIALDPIENKYQHIRRDNASIIFYADNARPWYASWMITDKSEVFYSLFGCWHWSWYYRDPCRINGPVDSYTYPVKTYFTPLNPYYYKYTPPTPVYGYTFTPGPVQTDIDGKFSFRVSSYVWWEFTNKFDIRLKNWNTQNVDLATTRIVTNPDITTSTFASLYMSSMKLGDGETSLRFGQQQSLIFTPSIDPVQLTYLGSTATFDNAQSIVRTYTGFVVLGVTPKATDPNTVYFTPELTGKIKTSPKLEAKPRVSYTIGGKNVSYPMSAAYQTYDTIKGMTGALNSIFVEWYQSSAGKDGITSNLLNIGNYSFSQASNTIRKNVAILTRNRKINDGMVIGGIKYISGDVTLSGNPTDWKTLVVVDGNVTFTANFNTTKQNLGLIVFQDTDTTKGNVYIRPNVGYIWVTLYADGSIMSTDAAGVVFTKSDKSRSDALLNQLVFHGALYTRNTIWGATRGWTTETTVTDYILPGGSKTTSLDEAVKYDLSFLRMGNIGYDSPTGNKNYNAWHDDSVVVLRNYESLSRPPVGFEK
jgi:hypothetical protein